MKTTAEVSYHITKWVVANNFECDYFVLRKLRFQKTVISKIENDEHFEI
jgi:hypothetical protein